MIRQAIVEAGDDRVLFPLNDDADNYGSLQDALSLIGKSGGGRLIIPGLPGRGKWMVEGDSSGGTNRTGVRLDLHSRTAIVGRGRPILTQPVNSGRVMVNVADAEDVSIDGVIIDSATDWTIPEGFGAGGHALRLSGGTANDPDGIRGVRRFSLTNSSLLNSGGYGVGGEHKPDQDCGYEDILFQDVRLIRTGSDGFDFKDYRLRNKRMTWRRVYVEDFDMRRSGGNSAIDVRCAGGANIEDVEVVAKMSGPDGDNRAVGFRPSTNDAHAHNIRVINTLTKSELSADGTTTAEVPDLRGNGIAFEGKNCSASNVRATNCRRSAGWGKTQANCVVFGIIVPPPELPPISG
jgi:hypothetical protein